MLKRVERLPKPPAFPSLLIQKHVRDRGADLWRDFEQENGAVDPEEQARLLAADAARRAEYEQQIAQADASDRQSLREAAMRTKHKQVIAAAEAGDFSFAIAALQTYLRMMRTTIPLVGNALGVDWGGIVPGKLDCNQLRLALDFLGQESLKAPGDRNPKLQPQKRKNYDQAD